MTRIFDSGSKWYKIGKVGDTSVLLSAESAQNMADTKDLNWEVVNLQTGTKNFMETLPYINKFFGTYFSVNPGEVMSPPTGD